MQSLKPWRGVARRLLLTAHCLLPTLMHDDLRIAILAYTNNPAYRAVKPKIIAERLGLEGDAMAEAKKSIKKMVRAGELEYGPNHLVLPVDEDHPARQNLAPTKRDTKRKSDGKYVTGILRRVSSGDGFVRPEGTPASAGKDLDIYVSKRNAGDAASGDTVRIALSSKPGPKGKPEGKLVDIVTRATNTFVGTYFEQSGMGLVQVDGKVFASPIYVGDPGAKGAKDDDKVVLEMVRFPSHLRDGEGVITRILGGRTEPGVDTLSIKMEYGLPGDFREEVMQVCREQAEAFSEQSTGEAIPEGRTDLTSETVITIDPATARDFDDAISLARLDNGHWELGVHIADVSHFVPEKTVLDSEAYDRATSVYLPDEVIPMLPEIISNNLASLQPDKVRYAMTARIEFTEDGAPIGADVFKSAIKSCRRFTYEEVDAYLGEKQLVKPASPAREGGESVAAELVPDVDRLLTDMFTLAMTLRRRRFERGSLELHMPEMTIDLDGDGRVTGAHLAENTESHQIIEEFMLAANEAVAQKLADEGLIFLRRVHAPPEPRKMRALTDFVRDLGFKADNLQDRFELQELLNKVKDDPRSHAVNFATLRSMQKAVYSPEEEGHYALASDCYCHFTSPIRRYPDLIVHRLIDQLNRGVKPRQEMPTYLQWGDHCSDREQRAAGAERELKKVKLLTYLEDKIGTQMDGVITGVESFGIFVMGNDLPAEGFIHITALGDDYFKFDRATHSINGFRSGNSFRLGDPVRVAVASVDVDARELDFRYLGRAKGKKRPSAGSRAKGAKPKKSGQHKRAMGDAAKKPKAKKNGGRRPKRGGK
ncbi:MAG: ribonuclease R [Planctomycetota bacterium]